MIGQRCSIREEALPRLTGNGLIRIEHYRTLKGVIAGESRDKLCWLVRWDGYVIKDAYHMRFIKVETGG